MECMQVRRWALYMDQYLYGPFLLILAVFTTSLRHKFIQAKFFNPKHLVYQSCTHSHTNGYIRDKLGFSVFDMQTGEAGLDPPTFLLLSASLSPHNKKFLGLSSPEVFVFSMSPGVCFFLLLFLCYLPKSPKTRMLG